jgi:hypothetical protein
MCTAWAQGSTTLFKNTAQMASHDRVWLEPRHISFWVAAFGGGEQAIFLKPIPPYSPSGGGGVTDRLPPGNEVFLYLK